MPDPKWIEEDKALVADCRPDGTPKTGAGSMSCVQNAALLRAHAHIAELRGLLAECAGGTCYCASSGVAAPCPWCSCDPLLDRQEPPAIEDNKPLASKPVD